MVDLILPVPSLSYDVAWNCFPAVVKFFVTLIGWQNDCHPTAVAKFAGGNGRSIYNSGVGQAS
eukprot:13884888-Heterocapsa_arctica.AAC.1